MRKMIHSSLFVLLVPAVIGVLLAVGLARFSSVEFWNSTNDLRIEGETTLMAPEFESNVSEIIAEAITATTALERFHYTLSQTQVFSDDASTVTIFNEGDYIAHNNYYLRATGEGAPPEEVLVVNGNEYVKGQGNQWMLAEDNGLSSSDYRMLAPWGTQGMTFPVYGVLDLSWEEFVSKGEESIEGMTLLHLVSKRTDNREANVWIDPKTNIIHRFTVSTEPNSQTQWYGVDTVPNMGADATPVPYLLKKLIYTYAISRVNDPSIILPTP